MTNSFADFAKAKMILAIGTNMTEAHPVAASLVKNGVQNGAELIVVGVGLLLRLVSDPPNGPGGPGKARDRRPDRLPLDSGP